jgi:hypothetical protein
LLEVLFHFAKVKNDDQKILTMTISTSRKATTLLWALTALYSGPSHAFLQLTTGPSRPLTSRFMFDFLKPKPEQPEEPATAAAAAAAATAAAAAAAEEETFDDPVEKMFGFFFGKKEEEPMGMKRFGRGV